MYLYLNRLFTVLCAAAMTFGIVQVAVGAPPPRFAGSYQVTKIGEDGAQVQFTLKFALLNPGNSDVKGGILVLMDSQPNSVLIGKVATISVLPRLGQKDVSASFSVSAAEYARWQQGHEPRFEFLVPSPDGAVSVHVQARPVPQPFVLSN